jgi:HJR/Mrr/RecB family endonuclease
MTLVSKSSGTEVAVLSLLLYGGIGLVLPLALGWPTWNLVEANVVGTASAAVVCLGWLFARIEAGHRRHLVEWTSNLRLLDSEEFEWLVGEVFRREGWAICETGRRDGPDGNIDLTMTRNGTRKIVQCKRWSSWPVGVDEIRKFLGTLMREKLPGDAGIYVTLSNFTEQAREEAEQAGIRVIDNRDLYSRIEKVRRTESCPVCGTPMILNQSQYGWWLRCVTPKCKGKRDLSNDPGRAVEMLIQPL